MLGSRGASRTKLRPSPVLSLRYVVALVSWVGWFLFAIFGGVGLAAVPIDLIVGYKFRPRPLKAGELAAASRASGMKLRPPSVCLSLSQAEELAELRLALQHRSTELGEVGARLKQERQGWQAERATLGFLARRRRESDDRQAVMKFKQMVYHLEQSVEELKECSKNREAYNPLVYIVQARNALARARLPPRLALSV